jgi:hypothetical protein
VWAPIWAPTAHPGAHSLNSTDAGGEWSAEDHPGAGDAAQPEFAAWKNSVERVEMVQGRSSVP